MGVPKFYRWLSERYPRINQLIDENNPLIDLQIDHLYFDMNGVLHHCTHPDDNEIVIIPSNDEILNNLELYLDRCINKVIKPRKSIYFAIDGVAPRAKLNQQRGRRFRSGRARIETLKGYDQSIDDSSTFDTNCITPGTEFMERVDGIIKTYIESRIANDPAWKGLEIYYSGHLVPGEGEHKIMQHIRTQRQSESYRPNQRHCLVGQDADLIMLGLATHEPHFTLLREVVTFGKQKSPSTPSLNSGSGLLSNDPKNNNNNNNNNNSSSKTTLSTEDEVADISYVPQSFFMKEKPLQLLHLSVLREYIEIEFSHLHTGLPHDRERLIDDFIFLTFLVGNDFIPHLPSLDISESAFDIIFDAYKSIHMNSKNIDYIVEDGTIKGFKTLEKLFRIIGDQEEKLMKKRDLFLRSKIKPNPPEKEELFIPSDDGKELESILNIINPDAIQHSIPSNINDNFNKTLSEPFEGIDENLLLGTRVLEEPNFSINISKNDSNDDLNTNDVNNNNNNNNNHYNNIGGINGISGINDTFIPRISSLNSNSVPSPTAEDSFLNDVVIKSIEKSQLLIDTGRVGPNYPGVSDTGQKVYGTLGINDPKFSYRDHHYRYKFGIIPTDSSSSLFLNELSQEYIRGLLWCLAYYTKGCISWGWYYPYHYAPLLSDVKNVKDIVPKITFDLGKPFTPFQQLLGCLPPSSAYLLPEPYQWLMSNPLSPLFHLYPSEFVEDMDGKRNPWEAVTILPFINSNDIITSEKKHVPIDSLTNEEKKRNTFTKNLLYFKKNSQSELIRRFSYFNTKPSKPFKAELVPGTFIPFFGFPSLRSLPISQISTKVLPSRFNRIYRHRTLILGIYNTILSDIPLYQLIGRTVYIHYPLMQEAKVIGIGTLTHELRHIDYLHYETKYGLEASEEQSILVPDSNIMQFTRSNDEMESWALTSMKLRRNHLVGGVGSSGLEIGKIRTRIIVIPVINRIKDQITGDIHRLYSTTPLDIPSQLVRWVHPLQKNSIPKKMFSSSNYNPSNVTNFSNMISTTPSTTTPATPSTIITTTTTTPNNNNNSTPIQQRQFSTSIRWFASRIRTIARK